LGDELSKLDPFFERGEVPIILPGIEILFSAPPFVPCKNPTDNAAIEAAQVPDIPTPRVPQVSEMKMSEAETQMDKFYLNEPEMMKDLIDNGKIIKKKEKFVSDNRIIDAEYWIKTTVDDVYNYLLKKYPRLKNSEIRGIHAKKT
jgi:hypothetical protein